MSENLNHRIEKLERALRKSAPVPPADPLLQASIMQAVRSVAVSQHRRRVSNAWWLIPAFGLAAALVLALTVERKPAVPRVAVLAAGFNLPSVSNDVAAITAPLSDEWAHVDEDLRNTARVLASSVP